MGVSIYKFYLPLLLGSDYIAKIFKSTYSSIIMYTPLTYLSLEAAKQARNDLRESEKKAELYRLFRNPSDIERLFTEKCDLPMRRFLYNFSTFNFMNLRRLDRLYLNSDRRTAIRKSSTSENDVEPATKYVLAITGGFLSVLSVGVSLDKVVGLVQHLDGLEKAAVITVDSLLLIGGATLLYKGLSAVKNTRKNIN